MNKYSTIVIDPPWKYGKWDKGSEKCESTFKYARPLPYSHMGIDEIRNIPVPSLAMDDCELYLWTTQKYLPLSFDIINHWGFKYCTTITWIKTPRGTGQGGVYTPTTEFLIHGRKGKMPIVKRIDSTWFHTTRPHNNHSKKPEFFQNMIERVSIGPRLEMFARRKRDGWDVWGNEVESDIQIELSNK